MLLETYLDDRYRQGELFWVGQLTLQF